MKKLFAIILSIILITSCSKTEEQKKLSVETKSSAAATTSKQTNRYGIKSGYILYSAPMKTTQTLYFDNYGAQEVFTTEIDVGVAKVKNIEIRKDGFVYKYEEGKNSGTKSRWYGSANVDYSNADSKMIERYKIKGLGTETILGKPCKKYSAEVGGAPMLTWSWNNLMIKSSGKIAGVDMTITATKIEEGPVDSKIFEVPKNVTFSEM
ncbi:MAG: hypothetical protein AB1521_00380 [Bacteroidota bacterium]